MKKTIFSVLVAVMTVVIGNSQESNFSIGVNAGLPVGDMEEFTTFNLGANASYRLALNEGFEVGGLVAYSHFFGDSGEDEFGSWEVEDVQFLPLAASARFVFNPLSLGADIGYALGINDGNDGGFYYSPNVGFSFGRISVIASYAAVHRDSFTASTANLGLELHL